MPARSRISSPGRTDSPAHPAREHRLAGDVGVVSRAARRSPVGSLIACGVRITSSPSVHGSWRRPRAPGRIGSASASPRMSIGLAVAPGRRQEGVEDLQGRRGRPGQLAAGLDQGVGGQDAGPAGVGDDRQLRPARPRLLGQHVGHVEDLRDRVRPAARRTRRNAASSTSSLPAIEPVCDAAAFAAASVRPALITMIGLDERHLARRREERPGVADRLHVDHDALRLGVVRQVVDQVAPADVEHRADRDERAEADVDPQAPVEDRRAQRAALAEEPDRPAPGHRARRTWH